jgi:membrane associated rhomboid family serine protease
MDRITDFIARVFTESPWVCLAWPAMAMIAGTLLGIFSAREAGQLAVVPRTRQGLVGLLTAPFVHANFAHLAANLPPFLVLGTLMIRQGDLQFLKVALAIALGQGVLLWLLGRKAAHVGMSGVIFGFFGWLVAVAWFTRAAADLVVAGGVLVFYGGMLAGLAPARKGVSWEGHLFGLVTGVGVAWFMFRVR